MEFKAIGQSQLSAKTQKQLDKLVVEMDRVLGNNLHSCLLYGSAIRGGYIEGKSDINLLCVLQVSTAAAQAELGKILANSPLPVSPFTLGANGLSKSMDCFAIKFRSIQRHYRVLLGVDPFEGFEVDPDVVKLLLSQSLRNLRLRLIQAFIHSFEKKNSYQPFLKRFLVALVVDLSDIVRIKGGVVPETFLERVPAIHDSLCIPTDILPEIIAFKQAGGTLDDQQAFDTHHQLVVLLDAAIEHLEAL